MSILLKVPIPRGYPVEKDLPNPDVNQRCRLSCFTAGAREHFWNLFTLSFSTFVDLSSRRRSKLNTDSMLYFETQRHRVHRGNFLHRSP